MSLVVQNTHECSSQQTAEQLRISKEFQNITEETTGNFTDTIISDWEDFFGRLASVERRFQYLTFCCWIVCISRYSTFYESSSNSISFWVLASKIKPWKTFWYKMHGTQYRCLRQTVSLHKSCPLPIQTLFQGKTMHRYTRSKIVLVQLTQFSSFRHISMHSVWRHCTQWLLFRPRGKCSIF